MMTNQTNTEEEAVCSCLETAHRWVEREIAAEVKFLVRARRYLHHNPELANQEYETQKYVAETLRKAGIDRVIEGWKGAPTAVIGIINPEMDDAIALRSDMDALPLKENTGLPFASEKQGKRFGETTFVSHQCGHDAHMAMLLTAAIILARNKNRLNRRIVLIFQPAEEGDSLENPMAADKPKSVGAKAMVENGLIEELGIRHVFGIHVLAFEESGSLWISDGPAMNSGDFFEVRVEGRQSHGATPWLSVDALLTTANIVNALQQVVARNVDLTRGMGVLTVGKMVSGDAPNVVPGKGLLQGTIRANDESIRRTLMKRLPEVVQGVASTTGAKATCKIAELYPPTINDAALARLTRKSLNAFGVPARLYKKTWGASEDFSFYAMKVPSVYMFLGIDKPDGQSYPNHSDKFDIDEKAMIQGVKAHIGVALMDLSELDEGK